MLPLTLQSFTVMPFPFPRTQPPISPTPNIDSLLPETGFTWTFSTVQPITVGSAPPLVFPKIPPKPWNQPVKILFFTVQPEICEAVRNAPTIPPPAARKFPVQVSTVQLVTVDTCADWNVPNRIPPPVISLFSAESTEDPETMMFSAVPENLPQIIPYPSLDATFASPVTLVTFALQVRCTFSTFRFLIVPLVTFLAISASPVTVIFLTVFSCPSNVPLKIWNSTGVSALFPSMSTPSFTVLPSKVLSVALETAYQSSMLSITNSVSAS